MLRNEWDVFLEGEVIDLIVPDLRAVQETNWYRWFNDPSVTSELMQGMFPNTQKKQEAFFETVAAPDSGRLVLLIWAKDVEMVVGVASLSNIDFVFRRAETAIVIGEKTGSSNSLFYGLEAKARLTEHAFETMGLTRVKSGQSFAHRNWQNIQLLFGFRPEGVEVSGVRKGLHVVNNALTACNLEDYLRVKEKRNGAYWPGKTRLYEMIKKLPKEVLVEQVRAAIEQTVKDFEDKVDWS